MVVDDDIIVFGDEGQFSSCSAFTGIVTGGSDWEGLESSGYGYSA